jgi:hypothetical protein
MGVEVACGMVVGLKSLPETAHPVGEVKKIKGVPHIHIFESGYALDSTDHNI